MERNEKEALVGDLHEVFRQAGSVVLSHYSGMSVKEMQALRMELRDAGASLRVTKNRLTKLALEGTPYEGVRELFAGPTVIAYSDDPVAPAKVMVKFANDNDYLTVIGGAMGESVLDAKGVEALSKMPSLDELRGKIIGILGTPATRVATVLQAPANQLARVCAAYGDSGPEGA